MKKIFLLMSISLLVCLILPLVAAAKPTEFEVTLLNQDPDPVEQGEVVEARFKIENIGGESLSDVEVEILLQYPFTLYTGEAIRKIGKIQASQTGADSIIVDYKLKVDDNAEEGDNEIELVVRAEGVSYPYDEDQFLIDVETRDLPDIKIHIKDSTVLRAGENGEITLEITKSDVGDAKFVELTLIPNESYELLSSSNYVYIGDIDSDDTETEEFEIYLNKNVKETFTLPVLIEYQDADEDKYEERFDLEMRVYSSWEASRFGLEKRSKFWPTVLLIIVAIVVYIYWKKRKKKS
jgi:hypothetical protein